MASLTALSNIGAGGPDNNFYPDQLDIDTSGYVALVPAYQKVWIADGRPYGTDPHITGYHKLDFINDRIVGTVTAGPLTPGYVLKQATTLAQATVDEVVTVGSDTWVLAYRVTTTGFNTSDLITEYKPDGTPSGVTIATITAVVAPPHYLPWILKAHAPATDVGLFPDGGSNVMCLAFGRIFMNSMSNANQWFATRAGDPLDLLEAQDDIQTAVSSQSSKAGLCARPLIALISYKDNYVIFGLDTQMWVLRSDPAAGGIQTQISDETGIFSPTAYCWDDKNNLYFLGMNGLYAVSSDAIVNAQPPDNITKSHLPKLIGSLGLNRRTDRVTMAYDKERYGISISVSQQDGAWSAGFWCDLRTGGIFPETYATGCVPASMLYFDSRTSEARGLILGCYDGYIRKFDEATKSDIIADDSSAAITSYAVMGPISSGMFKTSGMFQYVDMNKSRAKMKVSNISITTGLGTDDLEVQVYTNRTAAGLISNLLSGVNPRVAKVFTGSKLYPSIRQDFHDGAIAIKVGNTTVDQEWSMEKITADIHQIGRVK
jgi:hypothetical protein